MKKRIIEYTILWLVIFAAFLLHFVCKWGLETFEFLNFDEIIFQLTAPITGAEANVMNGFYFSSLIPSIILSLLVVLVIFLLVNNIFDHNKYLKIGIVSATVISFGIVFLNASNSMGLTEYAEEALIESKFIEKNYVDPNKVNIKFPDKKKNLIHIYVESLESSYFSEELGGSNDVNPMEPITELTKDNLMFSNDNDFGGAYSTVGTTWTSGALVGQTSGLPLKPTRYFSTRGIIPGATTLGDILDKNGYNQTFMIGSEGKFGLRKEYFEDHGNYKVYDYTTMIENKDIDPDYRVWWGVEDKKLFEFSKKELERLNKENKPFNLTLLTANTHFQDGYIDDSCTGYNYNDQYSNSIYCSVNEINEFIKWVKKQDFYDDTTIIITGDHISMQKNYFALDKERTIYNLFINSKDTTHNKNRKFSSLDIFPTTLSALDVEIEGNKLGLGTDLFSGEKTLMEKYGKNKVNKQLEHKSSFYVKKFLEVRK